MEIEPEVIEKLRGWLLALQDFLRAEILTSREQAGIETMSKVSGMTAADTIYEIDRVSEAAIVRWFEENWPADRPVQVVMEGIEDDAPLTFPRGTAVAATAWKCILDPIDGTRGLMYDKRSAWALGGIAPQRGEATSLRDIVVAAMTEIPTTKQFLADQVSGLAGGGPEGIRATRRNVETGASRPLDLQPSRAATFQHGFAVITRFFPEGKQLLAQIEEELWRELYGPGSTEGALVFEDQYICSGGQFYELLAGHDRMIVDLRPLVFRKLGYACTLTCHPYDLCTELILREAGVLIEKPEGGPLDAPLNTTAPVAWMGFANATLAGIARPVLHRLIAQYLG